MLLWGGMFPVSQNSGTSIPVFGSQKRKSSSVPDECSTKLRRTANLESNKVKVKNNKCRLSTGASPSTIHETPIAKTTLLDIEKDMAVASQAIVQYVSRTWWSWDAGSGLLFWRWPTKQSRIAARDGFEVYVSGKLPHFKRKHPELKDEVCIQLAHKVGDV